MEDMEIVDKFEYKGRDITVHKDSEGKYYFDYLDVGKQVRLPIEDIKNFIDGQFSHTTIQNNTVDMIERSVKINGLLYDLQNLKSRIKKYN